MAYFKLGDPRALLMWMGVVIAVAMGIKPIWAADYPERPIKIVVPFSAGGGQDLFIRAVRPLLVEELSGAVVVIENRPGAAGNIAATFVANALPDGYTLLQGTAATHGMNQAIYKDLQFDAQKSFEPVRLLAEVPLVLVVNSNVPANNVTELVEYLRAKPGKYSYGSSGTGAPLHLAGEVFKKVAGVDIQHVPYKGSAPAIVDLLAGITVMQFDTLAVTNPYVKAGRLKRLGVASANRIQGAPDLPTLREQGYDVQVYSWSGIFAPARTPATIIDKLSTAFGSAVNAPSIREKLYDMGYEPVVDSGPAHLRALVASELEKWKKVVELAGVQAN
ncbi:MAG: tripartite tricarboxylate transporter substrate binding protein [Burkholderiales bacterium]|nr:tripartite tricarboxylate transporter substrate binding protein [Burkholderiales bacterium]